jgi:isopentenyl phosphate kinase
MMNQQSAIHNLQFLKLGGSLITDKSRPSTPRPEVLARLAEEIAAALGEKPEIRLVLGHGSGSFGHVAAEKYGTRQGVETEEEWFGFAQVWMQAAALNQLVMDALQEAGLAALSFPVSSGARVRDGKVVDWDLGSLKAALAAGVLPVVYGDVAFDTARGGTILSTEDIFNYLAKELQPQRILLAGIEPGVWVDYPACTQLIPQITPANLHAVESDLSGSAATDVTGGMASKVYEMLALAEAIEGLEILIFSGVEEGVVQGTVLGKSLGTQITAG